MMTRQQLLIEIRSLIIDESLSSAPEAILSLVEKNTKPADIHIMDSFHELLEEEESQEDEFDNFSHMDELSVVTRVAQ